MTNDAKVRAGQLRHVLWLENPGPPIPDGDGGFTQSWTPLTPPTMSARIEPVAGRNLEHVAGSVIQTRTVTVTMRYHAGVTVETRLRRLNGHYLRILSLVNPEERNINLVLQCVEVAP